MLDMSSADDNLTAVLATVAANPGISGEALRAAHADMYPGDCGMAIKMLGSCRQIAYVFDRFQGVGGYYLWDKAPTVSLDEKRARRPA
jgi:hypothetical protein